MQQESQIYESIISNILVAGDVDNSPQKKSSEVWGTFGFYESYKLWGNLLTFSLSRGTSW